MARSQEPTAAGAPKKARDTSITVGEIVFATIGDLRARVHALLLAKGLVRKEDAVPLIKWHTSLLVHFKLFQDKLGPTPDMPEDDADPAPTRPVLAAMFDGEGNAVVDDDDDDDGMFEEATTIGELGKVGKLPSTLDCSTQPLLLDAAGSVFAHMRSPSMLPYLRKMTAAWIDADRKDDKPSHLFLCAALLAQHIADAGPVLQGKVQTAEFIDGLLVKPLVERVDAEADELARASSPAPSDGSGASSDREAIFTLDDYARMISLLIDHHAQPFIDAYRASLSRAELDAGMRNTHLFKELATLFNDTTIKLDHPDEHCEWIKDMDPNKAATFEHTRSGDVIMKKWQECKANYTKVRANPLPLTVPPARPPPRASRAAAHELHEGGLRRPRRGEARLRELPAALPHAQDEEDLHVRALCLLQSSTRRPRDEGHSRRRRRRQRRQAAAGRAAQKRENHQGRPRRGLRHRRQR